MSSTLFQRRQAHSDENGPDVAQFRLCMLCHKNKKRPILFIRLIVSLGWTTVYIVTME